jgi:tetratricopeptide (TPR) repeat protein
LKEKILGQEHPDTLQTMNNLANALHHQDKYKEAEKLYQQTLELREKILGHEHPDTLKTMNCLALVLEGNCEADWREIRSLVQQCWHEYVCILF